MLDYKALSEGKTSLQLKAIDGNIRPLYDRVLVRDMAENTCSPEKNLKPKTFVRQNFSEPKMEPKMDPKFIMSGAENGA